MRFRGARWRLVLILFVTIALGAVLAVVKGRECGLGYFVGNLSTPYLLGAFFAGRAVVGRLTAGVVGVMTTWTMLGAFYLSAELAFGYPSGSMTQFYSEWFAAGALSGTAMGLLGQASRDTRLLRYVLPVALVLEPFAVAAVQLAGRFGGLHLNAFQLAAWCIEIVVGIIALVVMRRPRALSYGRPG